MEILVAATLLISGLILGALCVDLFVRWRMYKDMQKRSDTLNENITAFGKAYGDFNQRALEIESQMSSIEFKVTGVTEKR